MRPIPMNTLRAFEAVGRHCHLRRAADELCLTHAALSRQVKLLEDALGTDLFTRQNNRLRLTDAGRRYLATVQDALQRLNEGALYLDPESMRGDVLIAATATISMHWLMDVIGGFAQRYPEVRPRLITIEPHQRRLPAEFDLAICLGEPEPGERTTRWLYQEQYFPVCSPQLLETGPSIETPADVLGYPLLHDRLNQWRIWFTHHGLGRVPTRSAIHLDYGFQALEAARRGLGIALADQLEVARDLRRGSLVRLLEGALPLENIYLVNDVPSQQTVRTRLFIDHLQRYLVELGATPAAQA